MKRRSFLAFLGFAPLAPVAVKAETQTSRFKPNELQKMRVADAQRPQFTKAMLDKVIDSVYEKRAEDQILWARSQAERPIMQAMFPGYEVRVPNRIRVSNKSKA